MAKGPQGAIYGRNAAGGAIIINTRKPTNEMDGFFRAGIGAGDEYSVGASIGGPIIEDQLFGRFSVNYVDRDGYLDNITTGSEDDPFEDLTVRGRLIWEVNDDLSADLKVNVSRHDGRAIGFQYQAVDIAADGITGTGFGTDTGPIDADNVVAIRSNNPDVGERDMEDVSLKLDWETAVGTFTSTSAYTKLEEYGSSDQFPYTAAQSAPGLFFFDGTQSQYFDVESFSQEIRLTSSAEQRFRWNVGAYYLTWDRFISSTTGTDTGAGIVRLEQAPTADPSNPTTSFIADDNDNTAWAIFGQANYDLTEQLELSFALRYDEETRKQNVSALQTPGIGVPGANNKQSFDAWQPKATLRYQPNDDLTLFATWGRGFRSGQFNQNGVGVVAAGAGVPGVGDVADQEDSESFEVGLKSSLLDDKLRVNASIFTTDVEGQHYFVFIGAVSAQVLVNIDEVSLLGAEIDAVYSVNDNFDIYAAYGITSSEIDEYAVNPAAVGNWAPYVPQNTFNIGGQYVFPLPIADTSFLARVDFERRGKQFWDPENTTDRSALELLNLRFAIQDNADKWSLSATIDNLTDENYNSEWVLGGFSAAAPGRTWGVDFRYNFF
ncbi:MAG: TonB-dependent receptor [Gammaproteobacteria bacterium]|nr:TonB-dependent receptor [Gammaproteobacteria bacterium]